MLLHQAITEFIRGLPAGMMDPYVAGGTADLTAIREFWIGVTHDIVDKPKAKNLFEIAGAGALQLINTGELPPEVAAVPEAAAGLPLVAVSMAALHYAIADSEVPLALPQVFAVANDCVVAAFGLAKVPEACNSQWGFMLASIRTLGGHAKAAALRQRYASGGGGPIIPAQPRTGTGPARPAEHHVELDPSGPTPQGNPVRTRTRGERGLAVYLDCIPSGPLLNDVRVQDGALTVRQFKDKANAEAGVAHEKLAEYNRPVYAAAAAAAHCIMGLDVPGVYVLDSKDEVQFQLALIIGPQADLFVRGVR